MIKELNVGSLGGLYYELYDLSPARRNISSVMQFPKNAPAFLDLNGFFWSRLLQPDNIANLLGELRNSMSIFEKAPESFHAAIQAPDMFINRVASAEKGLFEQNQSEQSFFGHVETLATLCKIFSFLHGNGYQLTIHEGYILDSYSSKQLIRDCLLEPRNPYLAFLREHAWPAISSFHPECVWLNGRLTLANMAVACFIRSNYPNTKIFWAGEASEYYASNKITDYLKCNTPLFEIIDGIVLFDYKNTRKAIASCLDRGGDLYTVNNLLFAVRHSEHDIQIIQTPYRKYSLDNEPVVEYRSGTNCGWGISPTELVNIHLFPNKTCFWRRCSFCGINGKYPASICPTAKEELWPIESTLSCLMNLENEGVRYFWSIDEAVPVETLCAIADGLSRRKSVLQWQARSRISNKFLLPGVAERLASGGLRELRLGLESASLRVLQRMNKFNKDFSLNLVEKIVATFQKVGIGIHFPMIIGFPMETALDRRKTYSFLEYLRKRYDNFSFNINIFALDISSSVFLNWDDYDISSVTFPCSTRFFLGNLVMWNCAEIPFKEEQLKKERDSIMREQLYPWLPENALVSPHIFYRLLETTRNTLFMRMNTAKPNFKEELLLTSTYQLYPSNIVLSEQAEKQDNSLKYYSFKQHACMELSGDYVQFLSIAKKPTTFSELVSKICSCSRITVPDAKAFIRSLIDYGFLELVAA